MTDTNSNTSLQQVQSSYGDVNTALENLLTTLPAQGSAGSVSGTAGMPSGGSAGQALFSDASGNVQFTDAKNGTRALALQSSVAGMIKSVSDSNNSNISSAGVSNAGVPWVVNGATGATEYLATTGQAGGTTPQVLGMSGNVAMQAFVVSGNGISGPGEANVLFPTSFLAGTAPIVSVTINREPSTLCSRGVCFGNTNGNNAPAITNTGFRFQPYYMGDSIDTTGSPWTIHVIAVGVV